MNKLLILAAGLVVMTCSTVSAQPGMKVTDAEKQEFFKLLKSLPTRGEFFTAEAITKATPFTRVLLGLTEKDLEKLEFYPFVALSRGLIDCNEPRQYGVANFSKIAHPTIKLFWASVLFNEGAASPEIVAFLRKALDSKDARTLSEMSGPNFEGFRERVIQTSALAKPTKVALIKTHAISGLPEFGGGSSYNRDQCLFASGQLLHAVRPFKQQGELNTINLVTGKASRLAIPQPAGFKAQFDFSRYFDDPVLSINGNGDLFCLWTIQGNGDHGIAVLKKGANAFLVKRVKLYLASCRVIADADGAWYLIQGAPNFTVFRVDHELNLTRLGNFAGKGHHGTRILDARFISKNLLHLFWGDVLSGGNHLRMRCVDFDVKGQKWLHPREVFRLDQFVSSANEPAVVQLKDDSLHYIWHVDEGERRGKASGLFYQAEADGKTVKIANAYQFRAIAVGAQIVVGYTLRDSPEKVHFRVIDYGVPGPENEIVANKGQKYNLRTENLFLYTESDRIWFVNTLAPSSLFELELADAKRP